VRLEVRASLCRTIMPSVAGSEGEEWDSTLDVEIADRLVTDI